MVSGTILALALNPRVSSLDQDLAWTDRLSQAVAPQWLRDLPHYLAKIQDEVALKPGSLGDEIWQEAGDAFVHPEIHHNARVRLSSELCDQEKQFRSRRLENTRTALARYLGIPEANVDAADVPIIALSGSGGGLRALVSGAASYLSAQEAGLLDCTTYTAGISGSCWLQTLYYSNIGGQDYAKVLRHLKRRLDTHIAYPPAVLDLLTRAPTNKYLLAGAIERLRGDADAPFGIVDIYGILLAARLMIPHDEIRLDSDNMKLSRQTKYLAGGANPLPLYMAVRHDTQKACFQWFEFSPYELSSDDYQASIPTWSIGRHFHQQDAVGAPEIRIPFLMGIWGSAFCATLAHYYKEVRPLLKGFMGFENLDELLRDNNDDMVRLHPIEPGTIPNFVEQKNQLELMDAGMSNNLPLYPLLRQGREVDVIVCFDASANVEQEDWLSVAGKYFKERSVKGWPSGAGWAKRTIGNDQSACSKRCDEKSATDPTSISDESEANAPSESFASISQGESIVKRSDLAEDVATKDANDPQQLGYCNVWVGSKHEIQPDSRCTSSDTSTKVANPDAGVALVYFPLLPNPQVPGVEPDQTPFLSTWNFVYQPHEIDQVVALARANFKSGQEQTRDVIRAVYERKKAQRLRAQTACFEDKWEFRFRHGNDHS